jgi:hypothetical protein
MKEKIIKVFTPNKMLFIKGKLSRTPLEVIIKYDEDINLLKSSMIHQGIDFKIEDYEPEIKKMKVKAKKLEVKKPPKAKKKITNPKTILEKLSNEDAE